jgi:hypothetical protein
VDGEGGAQLAPFREAALEGLADGRERRLAGAVNAHAHRAGMAGSGPSRAILGVDNQSESGSRKALSLPVRNW